ncbi:MAG: hypothetical protein ACFFD5_12240 [Candidatus Thorarchaeota archaeon]
MYMEGLLSKNNLIEEITNQIKDLGFNIERNYVEGFIENFEEKYERLPRKDEIKPIVISYMKLIKKEEESIKNEPVKVERDKSLEDVMDPIIKRFRSRINLVETFKKTSLLEGEEEILTFPKPEGRRVCPVCGNDTMFNIHEFIDKTNIICAYPRIYGKKYTCDGCGCVWREK